MAPTQTSPASVNGAAGAAPGAAAVQRRPFPRVPRLPLVVAAAAIVLLVAALFVWRALAPPSLQLATVAVGSGTLVRTVTSSGTVNPQNLISIGSQISGTISEIDADYNSVVKTGQVLARLDPTQFQTSLDSAEAQLAQTEAAAREAAATASGAVAGVTAQRDTATAAAENIAVATANAAAQTAAVGTAQAGVVKAQSALVLAQQTMSRDTTLLAQGFIAQSAADADQSALDAAQAGVASAQAALAQARSQAVAATQQENQAVAQSHSQLAQNAVAGAQAQASAGSAQAQAAAIGIELAQVRTAQYNLAHTTITAPVNGTVISRNISLGETVAASFSTPVLYTIAQDLSKMEIDLAVGEPDIGAVRAGDPVTFTVLAYPTVFSGTVSQVRQNPTVVSNVVTYDTVVIVDNKAGLLRPGMTANAQIQTQSVANALLVPVAALEWRPAAGSATSGTAAGSKFGATLGAGAAALPAGSTGHVYVERDGQPRAVPVSILMTAGTQAAVKALGAPLQPGDLVVTGTISGTPTVAATRPNVPGFGGPGGAGGAARAVR
jgi:HlyD family secretion protein